MSTARFEVEKFDGKKNFELWKIKIHDLLVQQGYEDALLGEENKPATMLKSDWDRMDAKALATIRMCLADEVLFNIIGEKTASGLWMKLEALYQTKSITNRIFLKRKLYSLKMKEGTTISEHLNIFNTIVCQLKSIGVKMDDEDSAVTLLCTLPESYDNLVTTLSCTSDTLTMDTVTSALLADETRRKASLGVSDGAGSEAFVVRGRTTDYDGSVGSCRNRSKGRSKSKGRYKYKCWECGEKGHLKNSCPRLSSSSIDRGSSSDGGSRVCNHVKAKEANQDEESISSFVVDEVFAVQSNPDFCHDWIVDSGATHHMCPHRSWFSTYKPLDGGPVLMGNNSTSKLFGVGTIRIKMFDGEVRELHGVRHVPDLKRGLLSLSALDEEGYRWTGQGGVIRIVKGALVVMKGVRVGNLYKLLGNTVIDDANRQRKVSFKDAAQWKPEGHDLMQVGMWRPAQVALQAGTRMEQGFAKKTEMKSLEQSQMRDLVDLPKEKVKVPETRWVYRRKVQQDGKRLVTLETSLNSADGLTRDVNEEELIACSASVGLRT